MSPDSAASSLIDAYEAGADLLRYAAQGLSPEQAVAKPGPGAWSIAQVVVHLMDSDLVGGDRMKRVIAEENPTLQAYDQDAWCARLGYESQSIDEACALFAANRRLMARILRTLDDADFRRSGQHTENGRMTLAELLAGYVRHVDGHLNFIYAKRANLGISLYPRYCRDQTS